MAINIPIASTPDSGWIAWHIAQKRELGQQNANDLFSQAWAKTGNGSWASNTDTLRNYAKTQGIQLEGNFGVLSDVSSGFGSINRGGAKIGNTVTIGIVLVCIMIIAAVYFLFLKQD